MKTYFISFNYILISGVKGFANCIKTSLDNTPSPKEIKKWEEEIKKLKENIKFINIMFFKEVK